MSKNFTRILSIIIMLTFCGCTTIRKMPHETFAKLSPDTQNVPTECVVAGMSDLRVMSQWQRAAAQETVEFWQDSTKVYKPFLVQSPTSDRIDAMVASLVEHYANYSDRASVREELLGYNWPFGLRNIKLKSTDNALGSIASPPDATPGLAASAWPRWVALARKPGGAIPRYDAEDMSEWYKIYAANREDILKFWLSVSLTVRRQYSYVLANETSRITRPVMVSPEKRPNIPLPLLDDYSNRMLDAFAYFSRFPVFRRDYDRFREVGGVDGCRIPSAESYAFVDTWGMGLFFRGQAAHWLATARVGNGSEQEVAPALVHQQGSGWFLFPIIGWGTGAVDRFSINTDGTADPVQRTAQGFTFWPLILYAQGSGLTMDGYEVEGSAYGVPLLYATAGFHNNRGLHYRHREALHYLLYWGEDAVSPRETRSTHAWGLGTLWYSHYNDGAGRSLNGPFWGWFGWGYRRGEPVWRIFGIPFARNVK